MLEAGRGRKKGGAKDRSDDRIVLKYNQSSQLCVQGICAAAHHSSAEMQSE